MQANLIGAGLETVLGSRFSLTLDSARPRGEIAGVTVEALDPQLAAADY
jgi:hypothetical protein